MYSDGLLKQWEYTWPQQFNVLAGTCATPIGVLMTPSRWKMLMESTVKEDVELSVYFLTVQKELEFNASGNEILIDKMIELAIEFMSRVLADKSFEIVSSEASGASIYDATDRNLTGVRVNLHLVERQGRCLYKIEEC